MEPRIRCGKAADGVGIAFWTLGKGVPVVETPNLPRRVRSRAHDIQAV